MGRQHRHRRSPHYYRKFKRDTQRMRTRKRNGWGMNLYRNTRDGKICGVCAGLADHWDIAHWVVRLMAIMAFLIAGPLAFWAYFAGWILMAPRTRRRDDGEEYTMDLEDEFVEMEYDERVHHYRPKKMFRYTDDGSTRLRRARERLDAALQRVQDMETYVTSRRYNLNEEFSKL